MALDMAQNFCSGTVTATTGTTVTYSNTGAVNFPTTLTAPYDITIWNSTLYSVPQLDPNVSIFRVTSATSTIFTGSWVSPSDEYASGTTLSLISGDTYSCTLFITAKMVQDLNTLLFGNLTSSNLSSTAGITGSQLSSPLNLSQNVTLGGTTTNNGTISGGAVNPATITASGLITADGGITSPSIAGNPSFTGGLSVPSGQTATVTGNLTVTGTETVSGTLGVTGTITVPNATTPTQPVALGQQPLLATAYFHAQQQEPSGTSGGSSVVGVNVRVLNTVLTNTISGASLSSNQITLPAGTYYVRGSAPAYGAGAHKASLYNVTSSSYALTGESAFCEPSSYITQTSSSFDGLLTITSTTVFQINHQINNAVSGDGLGVSTGQSGVVEVYSDIEIWQLG